MVPIGIFLSYDARKSINNPIPLIIGFNTSIPFPIISGPGGGSCFRP
jgi:hypothetical protein